MWQALRSRAIASIFNIGLAFAVLTLGAGMRLAQAQDLVVGDDGLLVISDQTKASVQTIVNSQESVFRSSDGGSELLDAVPVEKTRTLTLPVVVLSNRKELPAAGPRSADDDKEFESAVGALQGMVPDRSGNWYHLDYPNIDPDLEVTQFCTREAQALPGEMLAAVERDSGAFRSDDLSTTDASIRVTPPTYETAAEISLTFIAYNVPCTVTVTCFRDGDDRCRSADFIKSFASPARRDVVTAPE